MKLISKPSYPPAPEGSHVVEIYKISEVQNKFNGTPQLQVVFKIVDKEGCSPLVDWFNPVLHPKAKIMKLANALKLQVSKLTEDLDFEVYVGRKLRVVVEHKDKGGRTFANIVSYSQLNPDDLY